MLALRALVRVVEIIWMIVLALAGLAIGLYCLDRLVSLGAADPPRLLHLPTVRSQVGNFLNDITAPGPTAGLALLCGLGAMLIGLVLLFAVLAPRRRRLAVLDGDHDGALAARPSALRHAARALADQVDGTTGVKRARLHLTRRGTRGRLTVTATRSATGDATELRRAVTDRLGPLTKPFHLKPRVRVNLGEPGERVQ